MARLNIAMLSGEDNNQEQVVAQAVKDHLEVLGQQVEDDLLQAQQVQIQSDQEDAAVNDAVQATEDLLEEQQAAEELVGRKEQVTQAAMESIQRNVKNILKNIGMECGTFGGYRYAAESEATPQEKSKQTSSGIWEYIQKIWESIKAAWYRIVDAIKGFFQNLFNAAEGLKKRAASIKEAAKKLKGKSLAADAKLETPESVKSNIRIDGKAVAAKDINSDLQAQNKQIVKIISDVTSESALTSYRVTIGMMVEKTIKEMDKTKEVTSDEKMLNAIEHMVIMEEMTKPIVKCFPLARGERHYTQVFISDKAMVFNVQKLTVETENQQEKNSNGGSHEVLSLEQIESLCETVIAQMDNYKDLDKTAENFKKFSKEIEKIQSDLINQKKDLPFFTRKAQSFVASKAVQFFMNVIKGVSTQARVIDMQVNKAAIDWCAASLKLYK